jgi:hypothetical protein
VESNHRENRPTGEKGETDHRRHNKQSPRKIRNGGTPTGYSFRREGEMQRADPLLGNDLETNN